MKSVKFTQNKLSLLFALILPFSQGSMAQSGIDDMLDFSLTDLLSMEITSVSKKSQSLNEVASAVFVITGDDIRRSGVTSIPEALRMAPGVQVAQIDANKWSISSRGFAQQHANKLLVLVDGRSVYTPLFSGVYWEVQDMILTDIERIEVIRGPGATVWGANAVNGVINIITKKSGQTQGSYVEVGGGNEEEIFASARYGFALANNTAARVYLKYNDKNESWDNAGDAWVSMRGGFRVDGQTSTSDNWTLQGDVYEINAEQKLNLAPDPYDPNNIALAPQYLSRSMVDSIESSGWNMLGKWEHRLSDESSTTFQLYYDKTIRSEGFVAQQHNILDLDFQHQFQPFANHEVIWGMGYRHLRDNYTDTFNVSLNPSRHTQNLLSTFIQDEIALFADELYLTLGTKIEKNDYTGTEIQPTIRLAWLINQKSTLWGSVSRAIRSPSRAESSFEFVHKVVPIPPTYTPLVITTVGSENYDTEELLAWEVGYRVQASEAVSIDLALFSNDYDNLRSIESIQTSFLGLNTVVENKLNAKSHGVELSVQWQPSERLHLESNYTYLNISGKLDKDSTDIALSKDVIEGSSPKHQVSLMSSFDFNNALSLNIWLRYVSKLEISSYGVMPIPTPSYISVNTNLNWKLNEKLRISLVGQNLFDSHHPEFVAEEILNIVEVERSIYAKININF